MSKNALSILAKITNTTANTANNQENTVNTNPFPAAWLAEGETAAILTVTRDGVIVQYVHCTDGAMFIEAPVPTNDGGRCITTVRNVRDWDYQLRNLALNGHLQIGDLVEVKAGAGYMPIVRLEITEVSVAPWWSSYGVRQPVENVLVTVRGNSRRFYGDGGYYCASVSGVTDRITGLVEADLSRW
jgi:hypothetical protein